MIGMNESGDEMISFPVPKRFFPVVVQALAKAMEADVVVPAIQISEELTQVQDQPSEPILIDWTNVENCKNLRREIRYAGALALLDLAAAHPDQLVSFSDVVHKSGRSEKEARADLGALTKAIKRQFGVSRDDARWPVEFRWAAGGEEQAYYLMRSEIAHTWTQSGKV